MILSLGIHRPLTSCIQKRALDAQDVFEDDAAAEQKTLEDITRQVEEGTVQTKELW